jgi:hypothetical protein
MWRSENAAVRLEGERRVAMLGNSRRRAAAIRLLDNEPPPLPLRTGK